MKKHTKEIVIKKKAIMTDLDQDELVVIEAQQAIKDIIMSSTFSSCDHSAIFRHSSSWSWRTSVLSSKRRRRLGNDPFHQRPKKFHLDHRQFLTRVHNWQRLISDGQVFNGPGHLRRPNYLFVLVRRGLESLEKLADVNMKHGFPIWSGVSLLRRRSTLYSFIKDREPEWT